MSKRCGKTTPEQYHLMADFIRRHKAMVDGKKTPTFTTAVKNRLWSELSLLLNACGGPKKDAHRWRRTWIDLKSDVKAMASKASHHRGATDGDTSTAPMTDYQEKVAGMLETNLIEDEDQLMLETDIKFEPQMEEVYLLPSSLEQRESEETDRPSRRHIPPPPEFENPLSSSTRRRTNPHPRQSLDDDLHQDLIAVDALNRIADSIASLAATEARKVAVFERLSSTFEDGLRVLQDVAMQFRPPAQK